MKRTPLLFSAILPLLAFSPAHAAQGPQSWFREKGYAAPTGTRIIACHGYGCVRRKAISVDGAWLDRASSLLRAGRGSAEAERRALAQVVGTYTAYVSASLGGKPDVPGSPARMSNVHGQMDCLDETANTTSMLLVLQDQGLLTHHQVQVPESRGFFFDGRYPHFTATIAEKRTGRGWAVDPWKRAPGQRPEILPLDRWRQDS